MTLKSTKLLNLLCKPNIYGPASDALGQETYTEAVADLSRRLGLGECAAALARYIDESSNTIKPVGTVIYSQDSDDPRIVNLELIAVREKYRLRQVGTQLMEIVKREARLLGAIQLQTQAPQKMPGLQSFLAKMVSITVTWKRARAGFCFCGIKKILRIRRYKLLGNYNAQSKFIRSHCAIKWLSILRWY